MQDHRTRRELLKTATGVAIGATTLAGTASATTGSETTVSTAGQVQDAPYTVVTGEKSIFAPEVLTIPAGATVTFRGNRYPHTVTSTAAHADVVTSSNCEEPYDGDQSRFDRTGDDEFTGNRINFLEWEHTIESSDDSYHVRIESGGLSYVTYLDPGEYPYYCVPHCGSFMMGKIQVVEAPE